MQKYVAYYGSGVPDGKGATGTFIPFSREKRFILFDVHFIIVNKNKSNEHV